MKLTYGLVGLILSSACGIDGAPPATEPDVITVAHCVEDPCPPPPPPPHPTPKPQPPPPPTGPVLSRALIAFQTNDDDKDNDTVVTVTVRDSNGAIVASSNSISGLFFDQSYNGVFVVSTTATAQLSTLKNGTVWVHIQPNGNDTWRFGAFARLIFADGSELSGGPQVTSLSQDSQNLIIPISGFQTTVPPASPAGDARLVAASATFNTTDDNKDFDTQFTVNVSDDVGIAVASVTQSGQEFPDGSSIGVQLGLANNTTRAAVERGQIELLEFPNGNDTWRFNVEVDFAFDDGTTLACPISGIQLTRLVPIRLGGCL